LRFRVVGLGCFAGFLPQVRQFFYREAAGSLVNAVNAGILRLKVRSAHWWSWTDRQTGRPATSHHQVITGTKTLCWKIGTKCLILNAKQDQMYPIGYPGSLIAVPLLEGFVRGPGAIMQLL
jgi:hypothetical protein